MDLIKRIQELENLINKRFIQSNIIIKIIDDIEPNKGQIIIWKDNNIDRIFKIDAASYFQVTIIENGEFLEENLAVDDLGKWLFNLYNPIKYLYEFYGGELSGKVLSAEQINKISKLKTENFEKERAQGILVHRKELDDQPIIENYLGPMFDRIDYGKVYLRYETQEIYDMLST